MMMTTMLLLMRGGDVNDVDGDSDGNYKLSMEWMLNNWSKNVQIYKTTLNEWAIICLGILSMP